MFNGTITAEDFTEKIEEQIRLLTIYDEEGRKLRRYEFLLGDKFLMPVGLKVVLMQFYNVFKDADLEYFEAKTDEYAQYKMDQI